MDLNKIYAPIEKDLEKVEFKLRESFPATNSFLKKINQHLFQGKKHGKRIRPALVLFSSKISSNSNPHKLENLPELISLAVAVELIHTASLIHDDIIDNAIERHNRTTLHQEYGNHTAILAGDILYAQAFNLLSKIGIPEIVRIMSEAVKKVCLGEIEETRKRERWFTSQQIPTEKEYLAIVKNKTAALTSVCCEAGALLSNKINNSNDGKSALVLRDYGLNFGLAYQIIDDYLDLFGEEEKTGKSVGIDLPGGTFTLPLIRLTEILNNTPEKKRIIASNVLNFGSCQLRKLLIKYKILSYIREKTNFFLSQAKKKIVSFCPSVYRDGLINLTGYVYSREK